MQSCIAGGETPSECLPCISAPGSMFQRLPFVASTYRSYTGESAKSTVRLLVTALSSLFERFSSSALIASFSPRRILPAVTLNKLQSRERFLEVDEIRRLFEAIRTLQSKTTRDFLAMCLFTGARRGNVAEMSWKDIFRAKDMEDPLTKNGTSQLLPLTAAAMQILTERKIHSRSP